LKNNFVNTFCEIKAHRYAKPWPSRASRQQRTQAASGRASFSSSEVARPSALRGAAVSLQASQLDLPRSIQQVDLCQGVRPSSKKQLDTDLGIGMGELSTSDAERPAQDVGAGQAASRGVRRKRHARRVSPGRGWFMQHSSMWMSVGMCAKPSAEGYVGGR